MRRRRAITWRDSWPIILGAGVVGICSFGSDQVAEIVSAAKGAVNNVFRRAGHFEGLSCLWILFPYPQEPEGKLRAFIIFRGACSWSQQAQPKGDSGQAPGVLVAICLNPARQNPRANRHKPSQQTYAKSEDDCENKQNLGGFRLL